MARLGISTWLQAMAWVQTNILTPPVIEVMDDIQAFLNRKPSPKTRSVRIMATVARSSAVSRAPHLGTPAVHAVVASATALARVPSVTAVRNVSVNAVVARTGVQGLAPFVNTAAGLSVPAVVAQASALAIPPAVQAVRSVAVSVPVAQANSFAAAPTMSRDATVNAVVARSTSLILSPDVAAARNVSVAAVVATATAKPVLPSVSGEVVLSGGGPALATAFARVPTVAVTSGVTFDAVGSGAAANTPSGGAISGTHTCTGTNRLVLVAVALGEPAPNGDYLNWTRGVKYGGVDMQSFIAQYSNNLHVGFVELYSLFNPPTGLQTITTANTYAPAGAPNTLIMASVSYTNALSITNTQGSAGFSGGPGPSVAVTSAAGSRVFAAFCGGAALATPSHTQRYLNNFNAAGDAGNLMVQDAAGASSVTLSAALADLWAGVGCSINPT